MIGDRLKRARAASGLSMQDLGKQVGVSANMIKKYEHDLSMPSSGVLIKLAKSLEVRSEYFFRPSPHELKNIQYRKRSTTPKKTLDKIKADILDQAERWFELKNLWPSFPVSPFLGIQKIPATVTTYDEIESIANTLRMEWNLGENPIPDLIDTLEGKGILVIQTEAGDEKDVDGLQTKIGDQSVIICAQQKNGDRQRFTLAHELGHLLLNNRLAEELDEEKACHRFAGAFLLPATTLKQLLGKCRHHLEPRELHIIKHEYGISMQACISRALDQGIITEATRKKLIIDFSKRGWRKQEPGEIYPPEETTFFPRLVYRALGEGIIGESKAAELLQLSVIEFHRERSLAEAENAASDQ